MMYEDNESVRELKLERLAAENWDKLVVVIADVQFFESLFALRTSACRKLHNTTDSVIILDETQMLSVRYLIPCIRAASEFVYNYRCTAVICTVTQLSLQPFLLVKIQELEAAGLRSDIKGQYSFFKRTRTHLAGRMSQEHLTKGLEDWHQVFYILGSRKRV